MLGKYTAGNIKDKDGNPTGGDVSGTGLRITWQNGPLGRGSERKEPNGAFVETVIHAALQRIQFYQDSKFKCAENAEAEMYLKKALVALDKRTNSRETQELEGLHAVHVSTPTVVDTTPKVEVK